MMCFRAFPLCNIFQIISKPEVTTSWWNNCLAADPVALVIFWVNVRLYHKNTDASVTS